MNNRMDWARCVVGGMLVLCATGLPAMALDVVQLENGNRIQAKEILWRESEQLYRVTTIDEVVMPIPKAQVARLDIAKPPELDKAVAMIATKPAGAIPILEDIVVKYRMKVWDNEALKLLAQIHMAANEPKKAADCLENFMKSVSKADVPAEVMMLYWKSLQGAGRAAVLKKELDDVVAAGSREMAAAAMVMRGNINREAGQKEAAVLDYLRVVILFENVRSMQPEALFKAAEILDELRDARADELKKKLTQEYKDSEYAAKLSGKI